MKQKQPRECYDTPFSQGLRYGFRLRDKINLPTTPDDHANDIVIGPTKWFFVPQDPRKTLIPFNEAETMDKWRKLDNLHYGSQNGKPRF